jgi:hypothetical protein
MHVDECRSSRRTAVRDRVNERDGFGNVAKFGPAFDDVRAKHVDGQRVAETGALCDLDCRHAGANGTPQLIHAY